MAPNPRRQDEALQALYDELPAINCQGLCHDSCGPIQTSVRERARMEAKAGCHLTCGVGPSCTMLTPERRCGVYEIRPMICRLWGITRGMPCPYGCKPERVVEDDEAMMLLVRADKAGGTPTNRERDLMQQFELQMRDLGEEEVRLRARVAARETQVRAHPNGRHPSLRSIFELDR